MPKAVITLDEQQVMRLEKVIIDQDEKGALKLLAEIKEKVKATQTTCCDPLRGCQSEAIEKTIREAKKQCN